MSDLGNTALALVGKIPDLLRSAKSDSLIEYTKPTRVEPIVLMDDRVVGLPFTSDIMQSLASIFSGYYLQAVALSVNVGRVDVIELLDKVNPNRSLDDNLMKGVAHLGLRSAFESIESYSFGLPVPGQPIGLEHFGLENIYDVISPKDKDFPNQGNKKSNDPKDDKNNTSVKNPRDTVLTVKEATNLSVGKLLEVEVESEGRRAVFPVSVRLIVTAAPPAGVVHTLSIGSKDNSVKERFHAWRSGQLSFIRDLVMCQDLIDAHKEGLLKDNAGIYSTSLKRRRNNKLSAILSGNPSVATASNIVVIAEETKKELERNIGGKLKDFRTREKIFKNTYAMIIVVVDTDWDAVTIYHRSIETPTTLSSGDIKASNRNKGPDVGEILKAYQLGNSPSI